MCNNNNLFIIPKLPNLLEYLCCETNKISNLPELPNSLLYLYCYNNILSSLPELPNSAFDLHYFNNPIHTHINKYFNGDRDLYYEDQNKIKIKFVNKIENWFLDCKYNPKYLYCKKRLMKEYEEFYN